jgi:hypothetical protein
MSLTFIVNWFKNIAITSTIASHLIKCPIDPNLNDHTSLIVKNIIGGLHNCSPNSNHRNGEPKLKNTPKLVFDLLGVYSEIDSESISGIRKSGDEICNTHYRFIVTNFFGYSRLVKAIIEKSTEYFKNTGYEVVFFTTQPMPLMKWFNYNTHSKEDEKNVIEIMKNKGIKYPNIYKYLEINHDWEKYTRFLRELVGLPVSEQNDSNDMRIKTINLKRCLLFSACKENERQLIHEKFMWNHANSWIYVPVNSKNDIELKREIQVDYNALNIDKENEYFDLMNKLYSKSKLSYLILPQIKENKLPIIKDYTAIKLYNLFILLFHPGSTYEDREKQCTVYCKSGVPDKMKQFSEIKPYPIPKEFFCVGLIEKGSNQTPDWILFLGGDVEYNLNRMTLEFAAEYLNEDRFGYFKKAADIYYEKNKTLSEWAEKPVQ